MNHSPLVDLSIKLACTPAAGADIPQMMTDACRVICTTLGIRATVLVALEPIGIFGSEEAAGQLGDIQHRAADGPLSEAARTGRPVFAPDLTRVGPPALAKVASESALTNALAVPLLGGGRAVGVLQLFETADRALGGWHLDALHPTVGVLAAHLADAQERAQLVTALAQASATAQIEQASGMLAERFRTNVEEAKRLLARHARDDGVSVAATAASVISGVDGPTPVPTLLKDHAAARCSVPVPRHGRSGSS